MSLQLGSRALLGVSSRTLEAARPMGVFQAFHTALSQRTLRLERRNGHLETQKYRWVVSAAAEVESGEQELAESKTPDVSKLDIRVGHIISVEEHPDADSLYVEKIDCGEEEGPRTIVSGLRKYIALEDLQDRRVVILANLKARNMRGIKSHGMLLCASNEDHTSVEPLAAPAEAIPGERVFFGEDGIEQGEPAAPNQLQKKKLWEACQPLLKTNETCQAQFNGAPMMTSAGPVASPSLANASIS